MEVLENLIAEFLSCDDYYDLLQAKLDSMPRTRRAADEILSALVSYDEPMLYITLLRDYKALLTSEEIHNLTRRYEKIFDFPLSGYGLLE